MKTPLYFTLLRVKNPLKYNLKTLSIALSMVYSKDPSKVFSKTPLSLKCTQRHLKSPLKYTLKSKDPSKDFIVNSVMYYLCPLEMVEGAGLQLI